MAMTITISGKEVLDSIQALVDRARDFRGVLMEIGEDLQESAILRFQSGKAPDGVPWKENKQSTIDNFGGVNKRPLIGETGDLGDNISYQVLDANTVAVGSPMVYANMQQYGGKKREFPHLWGDIPARPFIGTSAEDEKNIEKLVRSYLLEG